MAMLRQKIRTKSGSKIYNVLIIYAGIQEILHFRFFQMTFEKSYNSIRHYKNRNEISDLVPIFICTFGQTEFPRTAKQPQGDLSI